MASDLEIPQELYESEISFVITCFWDTGFEVKLGVGPDYHAHAVAESFEEVCRWLREAAVQHYPVSSFAKKHRSEVKIVTLPVAQAEE